MKTLGLTDVAQSTAPILGAVIDTTEKAKTFHQHPADTRNPLILIPSPTKPTP